MKNLPRKKLSEYSINVRMLFYCGLGMILLGICSFILEFQQIYLIINNIKFIIIFGSIGLLFSAIMLSAFWHLIKPILLVAPFLKSSPFYIAFGFLFFIISVFSFVNHHFAKEGYKLESSRIVRKSIFHGKNGINYNIDLVNNVFSKSIQIPAELYHHLHEGQYVAVKVKKGMLGFYFIDLTKVNIKLFMLFS